MEVGESVLETIFDDEGIEDGQDVEMQDVEEGELVEPISKAELGVSCDVAVNQVSNKRNSRRKKKKKKNKQKTDSDIGPNVNDINRFVLDACKRLRERKSYLMYTAVGCLGVSALSDLIKEVAAIQACGGQKTFDGGRFRNGGGILWNIIKVREPNAYKEIMRKGKEFEKQFNQHHQNKQPHAQQTESSSQAVFSIQLTRVNPIYRMIWSFCHIIRTSLNSPVPERNIHLLMIEYECQLHTMIFLKERILKWLELVSEPFLIDSLNLHPKPLLHNFLGTRSVFVKYFISHPLGWRNDQKHEARLNARFFMYSNFWGYNMMIVSLQFLVSFKNGTSCMRN